jgi:hypothetical protein
VAVVAADTMVAQGLVDLAAEVVLEGAVVLVLQIVVVAEVALV